MILARIPRSIIGSASFILVLAAYFAFAAVSPGSETEAFMPHAHCYLFNRKLILLHGWSDFLIGLSYISISATLTYLVLRLRRDLPFHWMMLAFALFIVACGATHFMEIWTLQAPHPRYWLAGWLKFLTAIASMTTAFSLPPLVPKIRAVLQSTRLATARKLELEQAYAELNELYARAVEAAAPAGTAPASPSASTVEQGGEAPPGLALMAKEVSVHARELERAKQAAEEANRAKDRILAVLSHELRTPLTPALAAASELEHAAEIDPRELRESIAMIRRNIALEARLVDDLLDVTRISKGKLEIHPSTTDLHETIRQAVDMSAAEANDKRAKIVLNLAARNPYVTGDGARLAQIFWNLILNAVKFTPAEGRVTVQSANPTAHTISIEVADNGIGIEPQMLSHIFEPFRQAEEATARRFGGIGLGLTIAKALVEAHGGKIVARSEGKGQGATFTVEFSTIDSRVTPPVPLNRAAEAPAKRSMRILLVEDHEDTRITLSRLLTRWGHVVKSACSVAGATEDAADFEPQILLTDVGLPDGTGMDLLAALRKDRKLVAIAMSGYGMESDLEKTARAGFAAHLVKPVAADLLKDTIDRFTAEGHPVDGNEV